MKRFILFMFLLYLPACSHALPEQYLARLEKSPTYPAVVAAMEKYFGAYVVWGGTIREVRNSPEGTYVEIIESPLNAQGRPLSMDRTQGRFLALISGFAEPAIYVKGKEITVAGRLRGIWKLPLGEIVYPYPVLLCEYDHLWEPVVRPDVQFGVGVGAVFGH